MFPFLSFLIKSVTGIKYPNYEIYLEQAGEIIHHQKSIDFIRIICNIYSRFLKT